MMDDIGYASPHAVSICRVNKTKGATKKFVRPLVWLSVGSVGRLFIFYYQELRSVSVGS